VKLYGGKHKTKVGLEVLRVSKCQNSFDTRYEILFYFLKFKEQNIVKKGNYIIFWTIQEYFIFDIFNFPRKLLKLF
jgi:hypothetical protein